MKLNRRSFLSKSIAGGAVLASIPAIVTKSIGSTISQTSNKYALFNDNDTILFQGDSITDAGREKEREFPNNPRSFGSGYAFLAASELLNVLADKQLILYNRGISGNKVYQLAERWEKDCINLQPNVLSILIGINDYWHMRNGKYDGTFEIYEKDYRLLLLRTKQALPGIKFVICEPFAVTDTSAVDETWIEPVKQYQTVAKKLAVEFDAIWVPFQTVFDEALKYAPSTYWTGDGVHPSMAGAHLMAAAWLKAVE